MTMPMEWLRERLRVGEAPSAPEVTVVDRASEEGFVRERVRYSARDGAPVPAFRFLPAAGAGSTGGGVVVFHQHDGEFHLGKSEVAGLAGDPLQAFAPPLARAGITVLAPDARTFEDRRYNGGTGIDPEDDDWLQHYNATAYGLVDDDLLSARTIDDARLAISVLLTTPGVDPASVGVLGHSYGGTTALWAAALDARCRFACVSGALASIAGRRRKGTGLNLFELIPGLARHLDLDTLVRAIRPRPLLVVSATRDRYSLDADQVLDGIHWPELHHLRVEGDHPLDSQRFDAIAEWTVQAAGPR